MLFANSTLPTIWHRHPAELHRPARTQHGPGHACSSWGRTPAQPARPHQAAPARECLASWRVTRGVGGWRGVARNERGWWVGGGVSLLAAATMWWPRRALGSCRSCSRPLASASPEAEIRRLRAERARPRRRGTKFSTRFCWRCTSFRRGLGVRLWWLGNEYPPTAHSPSCVQLR